MAMHLLFLLLLLTPTVLSHPSSDIHGRDVSSSTNANPASRFNTALVYAKEPDNAYAVDQSNFELEELYGSDHVIQDHDEQGRIFWKISLEAGDSLDRLKGLNALIFEGSDQPVPRKAKTTRELVARDNKLYIASPSDPNNAEQVKATREFLDGKVVDKSLITEVKFQDKVLIWGSLQLDDAAKTEVEANAGIKGPLTVDGELINLRALEKRSIPGISAPYSEARRLASKGKSIVKRAITWKKQRATPDLIMDSAFPGSSNLRDFVHDSKAGEDIWIYVVDNGIAIGVENNNPGNDKKELITPNLDLFIQTPRSVTAGQRKDVDDDEPKPDVGDPGSHGTMMAVKAAGTRYGLAKKATIIPVKIMNLESDLIEGFAQIWEHIVANKRESRSVIVCSKGTANPTTRDAIVNDPDLSALLVYFDAIMDLGTPIVFAAGNAREGATRQDIDTWPQLLESATTPVINVGAAKRDGGRKEDSQGGGQLTVHAPGDRVHSLKKDSRIDLFDGTSVAAPAVAGLIATYLAQGGGPWEGKNGKERVAAIKTYLQSDLSSWVRKADADNARVIWNGADKPAHDSATSACVAGSRKRKRQETDDEDPVDCSVEPSPSPAPSPVPTVEPVPEPTPEPTPEPQPAPPPPQAACKVLEQGLGAGKWEVKGGGWGNDGGSKLSGELGAEDFKFTPGGMDGFEWSATFVSEKSVGDIEKIVNGNAGGGVAVTCTK